MMDGSMLLLGLAAAYAAASQMPIISDSDTRSLD